MPDVPPGALPPPAAPPPPAERPGAPALDLPAGLPPERAARLALRSRPRQDDFSDVELPALPQPAGMVSAAEGRYLYWLTRYGYTGAGSVVEVGSWLGKSAVHLAAGLRDAGLGGDLVCFDRFRWDASHRAKAPLDLAPGADLRPLFAATVRPVYPRVTAVKTEIEALRWEGGPIEILFLDAPKRLPEIRRVLSVFAPSLIPGVSLVAFQDFLHPPSYALALVASRLEAELELVHVVARGSTVGFRLRRPLALDAARLADLDFFRWPRAEALAAWRRTLDRIEPADDRRRLEPGLALFLHDAGDRRAAARVMSEIEFLPVMEKQWRRFADSGLYLRYRALFRARGIRRPPSALAADLARRARRAARHPLRAARRLAGRLARPSR